MYFLHTLQKKIQYAIDRYQNETRRLYEVLNKQLEGKDYIIGEVSVADFATFPWVNIHDWAGVSIDGLHNIERWLKIMNERPATAKGLTIPPSSNAKTEDQIKVAQKILV